MPSFSLTDSERAGTTSYTLYATTTFTGSVIVNQNSTYETHTMPFAEFGSIENQYETYQVSLEMSDFSTRSYVSEDFSDSASLIEDNYTLWANISQSLLETNFNITNFVFENCTIENNETVKLELTGNYIAEYTFTNDAAGSDPSGWTVSEDTNCHVDVISNKDGHSKVVEFYDNNGAGWAEMRDSFTTQSSGSIEFWIYYDKASTETYSATPYMYESGALKLYIFTEVGELKYFDSAHVKQVICSLSNNQWYHMKIDFDIAQGWEITVNGITYGSGYSYTFYNPPTSGLDEIYFSTRNPNYNYYMWIDAINYSWASGYFENRNYNNTYHSEGFYQSPVYDIGFPQYSDKQWYYETLKFYRVLATNTALTCEYRYSDDNQTWSSWSAGYTTNQTINENKSRYLQFRINLTSLGNYTYTPECGWVELDYKLCSYTIVDEYVDVGIIKSWADYSSMVSNVFVDVQAKCSDEELKIAVLGDANNKSITVINNTGSTTFYTGSQEFVVFELSDYGIAYIENITCTGSPGQYFSSIVLHQNWNFESVSTIGMHMGLVLNADNTFSCRFANTTTFSVFDTTAYFEEHNNPVGTIPFELMHQLHFNVSFTTGDMMNVATDGCNFFLEFVFRNGTFVYDMIYYWNYTKATPGTNKTGAYGGNIYFLFDMQENTEYNIIRNISADIYNVFGVTLDESFITNQDMWSCGITVPNLQLNYVSFYENRSSYDIAINGTYGSQVLSTTGYTNTLNFSSLSSNLTFNYICIYSITFSGQIGWNWPSFIFSYRQLNQSIIFINLSFTELPPWRDLYYPDNLEFYLLTALSTSDVDTFLTSDTDGLINSTLFTLYRGSTDISLNDAWNFIIIVNAKEDLPVGTPPPAAAQTTLSTFEIALWVFIAGICALSITVVYTQTTGISQKKVIHEKVFVKDAKMEKHLLKQIAENEKLREKLARERRRRASITKGLSNKIVNIKKEFEVQISSLREKFSKKEVQLRAQVQEKEKELNNMQKKIAKTKAQAIKAVQENAKRMNKGLQEGLQDLAINLKKLSIPITRMGDKIAQAGEQLKEGVSKIGDQGRNIEEKITNSTKKVIQKVKKSG